MKKQHEFLPGDRVQYNGGEGGAQGVVVASSVVKGKVFDGEVCVVFDGDKYKNGLYHPAWVVCGAKYNRLLRHDTLIRVGDWVRVDMVEKNNAGDIVFTTNGPFQVVSIDDDEFTISGGKETVDDFLQWVNCNNVVKVQPPTTEISLTTKEKTMPAHTKRKFIMDDCVQLTALGPEITSTSVKVGDRGKVKNARKNLSWVSSSSSYWEYQVVFSTINGPRSQWVGEDHLAPYIENKDPMLERLDERIANLYKQRKDLLNQCDVIDTKIEETRAQKKTYQDMVKWMEHV